MKKWITLALALFTALSLCACAGNETNTDGGKKDEKVTVAVLTKVAVTNAYGDETETMDSALEYDGDYNLVGCKIHQDGKLYSETTYDKDPYRPLLEQEYDEDGNKSERQEYTYDTDGNQLTHTKFDEDGAVEWKYAYTYDGDGNMLTEQSYTGDELDYETLYTYDEHGNLLTETNTNEVDGWLNTYENSYNDGKLTEVKRYADDALSSCTQYDSDGHEILSISYVDGEEWDRTKSIYDNGKLVKTVSSVCGEESGSCEYIYDEDGKLTQQIYNYGDEYVYQATFTYNDNGDVINVSRYLNDDLVSEITLTYETVTVSSEQAKKIEKVHSILGMS